MHVMRLHIADLNHARQVTGAQVAEPCPARRAVHFVYSAVWTSRPLRTCDIELRFVYSTDWTHRPLAYTSVACAF